MKRRNNEQPTDKKPVVANKKLWRELTEGLQGKVRGGKDNDYTTFGDLGQDTLDGGA